MSGANQDVLALHRLDIILTVQAGCTCSGCDLERLALRFLETIKMGGHMDELALCWLHMVNLGWL
jgi:hypothetical protein